MHTVLTIYVVYFVSFWAVHRYVLLRCIIQVLFYTTENRIFQDDLESLRHSTSRDMARLATELAKNEQEKKHLSDLVAILRESTANDSTPEERVNSERKLLEQRLEEAHLHLADIKTSWSDKIASLETQVRHFMNTTHSFFLRKPSQIVMVI